MSQSRRSFDNWNKYTDNDNKPLHGCIMFMVNLGNTVAPIYDKDGTHLNNPQLTDVYGRTQHQVFIEEDVIAYYYKYIGNGLWYTEQNIDPSDNSKWDLQYTSKSELFINIESDSKSTYAVNNIEDLRNINVANVPSVNGYKIITLMGYNVSGDKEPINYIWNSESVEPDDGGAIIATDLIKGRWVMVTPTEHLDVRHYGVFPSDSQNMIDQTLAIQSALIYANNHGLRLFFDTLTDVQNYHYYKLTNITLNPINQIDLAKGVTFIDDDVTIHSQQTNAFRNDPYFLNGDTTLYSNYAKASWNIKALNKANANEPATYIIDSSTSSANVKSFQDWNVVVNTNITGYTFNLCNISGTGLIDTTSFTSCNLDVIGTLSANCTFNNCKLTERMFNGSPTPQVVNSSCTVDIDDFTNKIEYWMYLITLQNKANIDFRNHAIPENLTISTVNADRTYSNFLGNGTNLFDESGVTHTYTFNNCTGNINLKANWDNNTYIFNNCNCNVSVNDSFTSRAMTIQCNNSSINFTQDLTNATIIAKSSNITVQNNYKELNLRDSTLTAIGTVNVGKFTSYNSIILAVLNGVYNSFIKDSQINKDITTTDNNGTVICYYDNNIFNARLTIEASTANSIVHGTWTNNTSSESSPITIDRTHIDLDDTHHSYIYKNNTGTMEFNNKVTCNVFSSVSDSVPSAVIPMTDGKGAYISTLDTYPDAYACRINLFTIGTTNVEVNVRTVVNTMARGLGVTGGLNVFLIDTVEDSTTNHPSIKKYDAYTFSWNVQNMPVCAGHFNFQLAGDTLSFEINQI